VGVHSFLPVAIQEKKSAWVTLFPSSIKLYRDCNSVGYRHSFLPVKGGPCTFAVDGPGRGTTQSTIGHYTIHATESAWD
jgi:hypothetical protein